MKANPDAARIFTLRRVSGLPTWSRALPRSLRIKIPLETVSETTVSGLHALCQERRGEAKGLFDLERKGDFTVVMEAEGYNVLPDRSFITRVEELCGRGSVRVID